MGSGDFQAPQLRPELSGLRDCAGRAAGRGVVHVRAELSGERLVMSIVLTGDARSYRQFVRFAASGSVASVHLVDVTQPTPSDGESNVYLDVSDLYPSNVSTPKVDPTLVQAVKTAQAPVIGTRSE